ncbi:unnamed protein product [Sphagnum troendelagicum]
MIFFVPFRGKILGVRRKITLSRRRSRGEEEEVGNKEKKLVRELCLLEEEEEEEEEELLTEVQHSFVCLLERSTQQQQRVLDYAVLVFSLLWVLVLEDVCGRGAGPKPAEACKIHFHSCGDGGGALDLRASRNVIRRVQHWRRIEAHE